MEHPIQELPTLVGDVAVPEKVNGVLAHGPKFNPANFLPR